MQLRKTLTLGGVMALALLTSACATDMASGPRFEWGSYESSLYVFSKKPDQRPTYQKALEAAIDKGRANDRIAPGLLAELGYLHLEDGDTAGAVALFNEEMQRFPESKPFLTDVVARAGGANGATR